jgi:hypothetical protein
MIRTLATIAVLLVGTSAVQAQAKKSVASRSSEVLTKPDRSVQEARNQYHAAQASLLSALASASALEALAETDEIDMDLARSYVHSINREAQACDGDSVKIGQAIHSTEKLESMKSLRSELNLAMRAIDDAQNAVDGHGSLGPHAKNTYAHLQKAMIALIEMADSVGAKPLPAPGAHALKAVKEG